MSFGISNVGVINQQNAPAIWNSNEIDFPSNNILGRMLIGLDTGNIFIETGADRFLIAAYDGGTDYNNGLTKTGGTEPGETATVQLGGLMFSSTDLESDGNTLRWLGFNTGINFKPDGSMTDLITDAGYTIVLPDGVPAVPTTTITLYDPSTGNGYRFAVEPV